MGRKHFETFGCEQERLWLELEKNMESQEEVFMVVAVVVVMLFKQHGLEDVETSVKRAVEESFLTSVPTSRFPSLSSVLVNLS